MRIKIKGVNYELTRRLLRPIIDDYPPSTIKGNDDELQGKVMVVVGGNSGIGLAIVKEYLRHGANVVASARRIGELDNIKSDKLEYLKWDVSDINESVSNIKLIINKYKNIDCVVLAAGVNVLPNRERDNSLDYKKEEIRYVHQINVIGVSEICKILKSYAEKKELPSLKIINIISAGAFSLVPEPYFTSKHAFYSFTEAFAGECKGLIKVYGIAPGEVRTKMIHKGLFSLFSFMTRNRRKAHPDEIAKLAMLMTSKGGDSLAGNIIVFDGGETMINPFL